MSLPKGITLLLLGVIGGMLIAPAKGSETREKLSRLIDDVSDSIQDIVELFHSEATATAATDTEELEPKIIHQ